MRLHFLQHVQFEGLGSIEPWALSRGAYISSTRLYRDEPLPVDLSMDLLVVMGGPMGVHDDNRFPWLAREKEFLRAAISAGVQVLGICLGAQLVASVLGANVYPNRHKEIGWLPIESVPGAEEHVLGHLLSEAGMVFHWHGDTFDLPKHAIWLARSEACDNQAFIVGNQILAVQFHLETTADSAQALIDNCVYRPQSLGQ
jgi:GMP synthase-like glutamine amidotransferase